MLLKTPILEKIGYVIILMSCASFDVKWQKYLTPCDDLAQFQQNLFTFFIFIKTLFQNYFYPKYLLLLFVDSQQNCWKQTTNMCMHVTSRMRKDQKCPRASFDDAKCPNFSIVCFSHTIDALIYSDFAPKCPHFL